jgi:hypothetical protein
MATSMESQTARLSAGAECNDCFCMVVVAISGEELYKMSCIRSKKNAALHCLDQASLSLQIFL